MDNQSLVTQFENRQTFQQIWRFVIVGFINTFIDFFVLNLLSKLTGIGIFETPIILLNVISFSAATVNSYFLNKYWSFSDNSSPGSRQFTAFLAVSVGGALINTAVLKGSAYLFPGIILNIADFIKLFFSPAVLGDLDLPLNIAKVAATVISLIWNFIGYKLVVFKK